MKITITKFYEADDGGSGGIDWYQEFKRVNKELTELKSQFQHPGKHKWLRHEEHPCKSCVAQPEFYTNYESDTIAPPYELDKEAKELVEKFADELRGALYSPHNSVSPKQCAIIHCDLMIKRLPSESHYYTTLKQKIEAL